jgi:serine/threonine protein kinase
VKQILEQTDESFVKELEVMIRVQSSFVVGFKGVAMLEDRTIGLVMEYCPSGALSDVLPSIGPDIGLAGLMQSCQHIAVGLESIHSHDIVHRDIACRNVLVARDGTCKLADFGLSRSIPHDGGQYYATSEVAVRWSAPETLEEATATKATDVYRYRRVFYWSFRSACAELTNVCAFVEIFKPGNHFPRDLRVRGPAVCRHLHHKPCRHERDPAGQATLATGVMSRRCVCIG